MAPDLIQQVAHQLLFNQFLLTVFLVIPMILVARAVVAGTRYSPILIIVVFGLLMGFLMVATGVTEPGLADFPMLGMVAKSTIVALTASFFVGGQELRKIFGRIPPKVDDSVSYATDESFLGTGRSQLVFIARAFFLLLGMDVLTRMLVGGPRHETLGQYYPLIAYMGLIVAVILIDSRAAIADRRSYLRKGFVEMFGLLVVLLLGAFIAQTIAPLIALPQIFFVMLLAAGLGALIPQWSHGPAIRCLLFAGIPVVLAANFIIGGSRISEAFGLNGMNAVLAYGFFGQVFWMFGGVALLILLGRSAQIANLGPGMAGALSHAGLTGACTAGDLGEQAARRAPIMINIPFFGHIFLFSILAVSVEQGALWLLPSILITLVGLGLTVYALSNLRRANGDDGREVSALMQFSFGWQLTAVFGGLVLLALSGMSIGNALMATSSSLSHFGLFAAIQGGMGGPETAGLIAFVFAMPFLVHPLVFYLFGRAMKNDGKMPRLPVFILAAIGFAGMMAGLLFAS